MDLLWTWTYFRSRDNHCPNCHYCEGENSLKFTRTIQFNKITSDIVTDFHIPLKSCGNLESGKIGELDQSEHNHYFQAVDDRGDVFFKKFFALFLVFSRLCTVNYPVRISLKWPVFLFFYLLQRTPLR